MSGNLGFGLAWWLMAGLYAALLAGSTRPVSVALSAIVVAACVVAALRFQCRWAGERANRLTY